jgi:hypothetical protein
MGNLMHSVALLEGFRFHTWELADSLEASSTSKTLGLGRVALASSS